MKATPTWKRVAEDICRRISSGETPVGGKLPSQQQLATRHKASMGTVKHALSHLASAGVLEGVAGSGVFVRRLPVEADLGSAPSIEDRLAAVELRLEALERDRRG